MTHAATALLCLAGFTLLLLGLPRQQSLWLRQPFSPTPGRLLRASGFICLVIAWWVAGRHAGFGYGSVIWFGWASLAAMAVITLNARQWSLKRGRP